MPPPPVAGAAAGNGLADGVRVADARALTLRVADGRALALRVADVRALTLRVADGLTPGVLTVAVGLAEMVADAEVVAPGDNFGSVAAGGDPAQATTDAEATMAAKPTAASRAWNPVPAMVVRIFMGLLIPAADGGPCRTRITTGGYKG